MRGVGVSYSRNEETNASVSPSKKSGGVRKGGRLLKVFHTKASVKRAEAQISRMKREESESDWKLNKFRKVPPRYREDKSLENIKNLSALVTSH